MNAAGASGLPAASPPDFAGAILPLLNRHCNSCHSAEKQKGDLDLEQFATLKTVHAHPAIWEKALEQITDGEMPPKKEPPLTPEEKELLTGWIRRTLDEIALSRAGDPGPVGLRRLSNTEYTWTVRDLTGVPELNPAREFPADGAAGEGFTNAAAALVMSPSLLTKYLDAAREVASHAVLLPGGIRFSASSSPADHTEEALRSIREFYARHSVTGKSSEFNLQGLLFQSEDAGVIPLEAYLAVTIADRGALRAGTLTTEQAAAAHGLSAKYLGLLWAMLNRSPGPDTDAGHPLPGPGSPLLDALRLHWEAAAPENREAAAAALAEEIRQWQRVLWKFGQVGQIGKKGGPASWQMPADPVTASVSLTAPLPPPGPDGMVTLDLTANGSPAPAPAASWENARLIRPGAPDLPLAELETILTKWQAIRHQVFLAAESALAAAGELQSAAPGAVPPAPAELAARHGVHPEILQAWLTWLGLRPPEETAGPLLTAKVEGAGGYPFVKGWSAPGDLSVVANPADTEVAIPGTVPAHGVAVHPAPDRQVVVSWRSPQDGNVRVSGSVRDAHNTCGNGVTWQLELPGRGRGGPLAAGHTTDGVLAEFSPAETIAMREGDLLSLAIGPRGGSHICDLTSVNLRIAMGSSTWDLGRDVSPDILEGGNPHRGLWRFSSRPDAPAAENGGFPGPAEAPEGSLLAKWRQASAEPERRALAAAVGALLAAGTAENLPEGAPDSLLLRLLLDFNGPLLAPLIQRPAEPAWLEAWHAAGRNAASAGSAKPEPLPAVLTAAVPSVLTLRIPAELAAGRQLAVTARHGGGPAASSAIQMDIGLFPADQAGSRLPADAESAVWHPQRAVLAPEQSPASRQAAAAFSDFRALFPAALCYKKIVPVDEVVTLTLYHREDHELRRLMLDDAGAAELDRQWDGLRFVSQEALKLVDVFDQLWQYATQDADPSLFEPMRDPIRRNAAAFRQRQEALEPRQVEAVLDFAARAWRRPLTEMDRGSLRRFHHRQRAAGTPHPEAVRLTLTRVLVAPEFLYRGEKPAPGSAPVPLTGPELATRLSYFLWSSAPDAELMETAVSGTLTHPDTLLAQTRRLLRDGKIRRLAEEFGCQWLHVRGLATLDEKSARHFPEFEALRGDMEEEVALFFTDLFQENRPVLSLLEADHTFVNGSLARHYQIGHLPPAAGWTRVDGLRAHGRGGMLGFAAVLAKQSGASRTSPILRGNWLSETVLGERLPRPPKDVPVLPEEAPDSFTERQLIERHSSDAACAGCHRRIDPFGFALEGFDAIGRARTHDHAGRPVLTEAVLPDGTAVRGPADLRAWLAGPQRNAFLRQFCRKLLGYALGRSVLLSDRPLVEAMTARLAQEEGAGGVDTVMEMIVLSPQFLRTRGQDHHDP